MKQYKRILSLLMAFVMILSVGVNGAYAVGSDRQNLTVERMDPSDVTANLMQYGSKIEKNTLENLYSENDIVRVMIVLEEAPAISLMSLERGTLAAEDAVAARRAQLVDMQRDMAETISDTLGLESLDVEWNLTLVTNAISANVQFGQISEIEEIDGVESVYVEVRYMPLEAEPTNIISQEMTGASAVQNVGYTGAGTRIAVVDTGLDVNHQSFSGAAFEYALAELAKKNGMSFDAYVASLNLLTVKEIAGVLEKLHVYERSNGTVTAGDLYLSSKLPFNYSYGDSELDVSHHDDASHGSHVAGISAANRYIDCAKVYDFDASGAFDKNDVEAVMNFILGGEVINNIDYADLSGNGAITTYDVHLMLDALEGYQKNGAYYISAYDSVRVTGVAPDAQLLTMKVFSKDGGTYASDYMAAVEDAITLGCDVVNLSLGAAFPGFDASYGSIWSNFVNGIMEEITKSGIVMSVAAGNSGGWADMSENEQGMMYADEAGTYTIGEPATYENAFTVASVNNVSSISGLRLAFLGTDGERISVSPYNAVWIWEEDGKKQYALSDWYVLDELDPNYASTDYELVFLGDPTNLLTGGEQTDMTIYGGETTDFAGYDFTGKIVLIARGGEGDVYYSTKLDNAALAGAAAVVIYNNVDGLMQPDITNAEHTDVPCAGISMKEAIALFNAFEKNEDGLYVGTLSITEMMNVEFGEDDAYYVMSDFSSWGVPGDLRIKPEITAPGGGIYSVEGYSKTGDQYQSMSGTSMAAPHLSGLAALLAQHLKENGILDNTKLSARKLIQSLLMSTAEPVIEEATGVEYSIRNQGAGLANIQNAILSNAYITVTGQEDGKVKAELLDGKEDRVVKFTITNFGKSDLTYTLSASVLTTGTVTVDGLAYTTPGMTKLDAEVTFSADTVTVKAGESVTVTATISVPTETAAAMEKLGYTNGFYIEGFLYINPVADSEGNLDAAHSIPMLGWYGNWSDPSMYDSGTYMDYAYDTLERASHIDYPTKNALSWLPKGMDEDNAMSYTGNVYGGYDYDKDELVGDKRYLEERNAVSAMEDAQWEIYGIFPTLIRTAGDFMLTVTDSKTGEVYYVDDFEQGLDMSFGSFYYANSGEWYDVTGSFGVGPGNWDFTDLDGNPLSEGTRFDINVIAVPEYYVENGKVDWENIELGKGTTLTYSFTLDNTKPELVEESLVYNAEKKTLSFTAQDNNYIAAVVLLNGSASATVDIIYPDMDVAQHGKSFSGTFDLSKYPGQKIVVAVCDYAGNENYYVINLGGEGASYGDLLGFQPDPDGYPGSWVAFDTDVNKNETGLFTTTLDFICAEYVNGHVYAQTANGKFYGIPYEAMLANTIDLEAYYITTLENVYQDLAYSYKEGKLYGLYNYDGYGSSSVYINSINLGEPYWSEDRNKTIPTYGEDYAPTSQDSAYGLTLACDDDGTLYMLAMTGEMVENEETYEWEFVLSETAYLWKAGLEETEIGWGEYAETVVQLAYSFTNLGDTGMKMDYAQSMTWDHNSETLYWARFYPISLLEQESELVTFVTDENGKIVSVDENGKPVFFDKWGDPYTLDENGEEVFCEKTFVSTKVVGTLSGETCALIAPLSDAAATDKAHSNVPTYTPKVIAVPSLTTESVMLVMGGTTTLNCIFDPWYSDHTDVIWTSSDPTVATVDENGKVTAHKDGTCTITVANAEDEALFDTCSVTVTSMTLNVNGIISYTSGGINSVGDSKFYTFGMKEGVPSLTFGEKITASDKLNYGLQISTAIHAKGSIWACEFGNSGMVYEIDPTTGAVKDVLMPIDGDMMYGFSYSEATGYFTGIMNFYLYVDLPLTHDAEDEMMDSYDEEKKHFAWHRFDLSKHLAATAGNFQTGETNQGSVGEIVFCGITDIENTNGDFYNVQKDPFDNDLYVAYVPTTTHVLLDNVGRLWYIDEIVNLTVDDQEWVIVYSDGDMNYIEYYPQYEEPEVNGFFTQEYQNEDGTTTCSAFIIRKIEETTLTDMFRDDTMPRITYHFSDIYYAGKTPDTVNAWGDPVEGADVFYFSLYDYWNNGAENILYLYIGSVGTGQWDYSSRPAKEIMTDPMLIELGRTGTGNIIASITSATPADKIMGLPEIKFPEPEYEECEDYSMNYSGLVHTGFYRVETPAVPAPSAVPSVQLGAASIAACVNRLAD